MRDWITIVEAISAPVLFHGTSLSNAIRIIHQNKIGMHGGEPVSLTRNKDIAIRFANTRVELIFEDVSIFPEFTDAMAEQGPESEEFAAHFPLEYAEMQIFDYGMHRGAVIVLDRDALRHRHSVQPYDDRGRMAHSDRWEFIAPVIPLIVSIDVSDSRLNAFIDHLRADPSAAQYRGAIETLLSLL